MNRTGWPSQPILLIVQVAILPASAKSQLDAFRRKKQKRGSARLGHDPGAQEKLGALGYQATSTDSAAAATGSGADPKDKIKIGNMMGEANYLQEVIRLDEAAALLQKVIAKEPNLWIAHAKLGATEFHRGNLPESVKARRKAVELNPDSVNLHYELSNVLMQARDYEAAVPNWKSLRRKCRDR